MLYVDERMFVFTTLILPTNSGSLISAVEFFFSTTPLKLRLLKNYFYNSHILINNTKNDYWIRYSFFLSNDTNNAVFTSSTCTQGSTQPLPSLAD